MSTTNRQAIFPVVRREPCALRPSIDYYRERAHDYVARHTSPTDWPSRPPVYYLDYGDKYARRFTQILRPTLSAAGQQWIDATCRRLQVLLEQRRAADPRRFAKIEEDTHAFQRLAYGTHAQAYIECGIAELPCGDLARIAWTPGLGDLLTLAGLNQVLRVMAHVVKVRWQNIILSGSRRAIARRKESI